MKTYNIQWSEDFVYEIQIKAKDADEAIKKFNFIEDLSPYIIHTSSGELDIEEVTN